MIHTQTTLMHTMLKAFLVIILMIAAEVGFCQPPPPPPPPPPPAGMSDSLVITNAFCHGGFGHVDVYNISIVPFSSYQWSSGDTTSRVDLLAGWYTVTITDTSGTIFIDTVTITEPTQVIITITAIETPSYIGASDGSITATASGGLPPYAYVWNPGVITTPVISSLPAGSYCLVVTDANGCIVSICDTLHDCTDCVWPGDADANHVADNVDLLYIGLAFDSTGTARRAVINNSAMATNWIGQTSQAWVDTFAGGINNKYADADGNGVVNAADTIPLMLNFGQIHAKNQGHKESRAGKPYIYPVLDRDSVMNGDTLTVSILLGDSSLQALNVYGVAFDIYYDPSVIDTNQTQLFYPNSWLGNTTDLLSVVRDDHTLGIIRTAVTRIDHTIRNGYGTIAKLRAIVTTDNIDGKNLSYYGFRCSVANTKAVNSRGYDIDLNEGEDSLTVAYTATGIRAIDEVSAKLNLYPNPANHTATISSASSPIKAVTLYNALGEIVASNTAAVPQNKAILELVDMPAGVYSIAVQTMLGTGIKKLIVTK